MDLNAIWAYFVVVALVLGITALPIFRFIDNPPGHNARHRSLDGLRGFAALSVFIYHLILWHQFMETGIWDKPHARFYALLGPIGVSLFFMVTGFLFWGKLLRAKGLPPWKALYIGRLFRIAPMYLFVVICMLVIVFSRTGLQLQQPFGEVLASVLIWLALGVVDIQPDVNGYPATHVLAGVTWTISYEWFFYASLLVTAYVARNRFHHVFVVVALLGCLLGKMVLGNNLMGLAALFLIGMTVASLQHQKIRQPFSPTLSSIIALISLGVLVAIGQNGYGTYSAAMLAVAFYFFCNGASIFGLLTSMPAMRLGHISYSLYLMQGLVLTIAFAIEPVRQFAMNSAQHYWAIGVACAIVLTVCAALGYILIEQPGIALGKHLSRKHLSNSHPPDKQRHDVQFSRKQLSIKKLSVKQLFEKQLPNKNLPNKKPPPFSIGGGEVTDSDRGIS